MLSSLNWGFLNVNFATAREQLFPSWKYNTAVKMFEFMDEWAGVEVEFESSLGWYKLTLICQLNKG